MFNNRMSRILLTGSLVIRFSMLIIAAGLLVAMLASPANASEATVTTGQVPTFYDEVASRQAHVTWLAAKQEVGMQATVDYLASINGSTATLASTLEDFQRTANRIPTLSTPEGLDLIQRDLRTITRTFREDLHANGSSRGKSERPCHGCPCCRGNQPLRESIKRPVLAGPHDSRT